MRWVLFRTRHSQETAGEDSSDSQNVSSSKPPTPVESLFSDQSADLLLYIERQLDDGVPLDLIASQLKAAGWKEDAINKTLDQVVGGRRRSKVSSEERDDLIIYILECFHRGLGPETIRTSLLRVGWNPQDINECLSEAVMRR
jgi:hypothetical protein